MRDSSASTHTVTVCLLALSLFLASIVCAQHIKTNGMECAQFSVLLSAGIATSEILSECSKNTCDPRNSSAKNEHFFGFLK